MIVDSNHPNPRIDHKNYIPGLNALLRKTHVAPEVLLESDFKPPLLEAAGQIYPVYIEKRTWDNLHFSIYTSKYADEDPIERVREVGSFRKAESQDPYNIRLLADVSFTGFELDLMHHRFNKDEWACFKSPRNKGPLGLYISVSSCLPGDINLVRQGFDLNLKEQDHMPLLLGLNNQDVANYLNTNYNQSLRNIANILETLASEYEQGRPDIDDFTTYFDIPEDVEEHPIPKFWNELPFTIDYFGADPGKEQMMQIAAAVLPSDYQIASETLTYTAEVEEGILNYKGSIIKVKGKLFRKPNEITPPTQIFHFDQ